MKITLFKLMDRKKRQICYAIKYRESKVMHVYFQGAIKTFSYKEPKKFDLEFEILDVKAEVDIIDTFSKFFNKP